MKRLIISAALIVLSVAACIVENIYLDSALDRLEADVSDIQNIYGYGSAASIEAVQKCRDKWENDRRLLSLFVNHNDLDGISEALLELNSGVTSDAFEFSRTASILEYNIEKIRDTEKIGASGLL